jgi:hypothetical protein
MFGPAGFMQAPNTGVGRELGEQAVEPMGQANQREHDRLGRLWATGLATKKQIARCRKLDRCADFQRRSNL